VGLRLCLGSCPFAQFFGAVKVAVGVGVRFELGMVRRLTLGLGELHVGGVGAIAMIHVGLESILVGRLVVSIGSLGMESGGYAGAGVGGLNHVHELGSYIGVVRRRPGARTYPGSETGWPEEAMLVLWR
jgi:hypothetical protein